MKTKNIFVFVFLFFSSFFIFKTNSLAKLPGIEIEKNIQLIQPTNTPTPTPIKIINIKITGIIKKIPSTATSTPVPTNTPATANTPTPTNTPVPTQTIAPTSDLKTTPSETIPTVTPNILDNSSKKDSLFITILAGVAISAWIIYGIANILKNKKNN